jgi:hypothetical protein
VYDSGEFREGEVSLIKFQQREFFLEDK